MLRIDIPNGSEAFVVKAVEDVRLLEIEIDPLMKGGKLVSMLVAEGEGVMVVVLVVTEESVDSLEDTVESGRLVKELCKVKLDETLPPGISVVDGISTEDEILRTRLVSVCAVVSSDTIVLVLVCVLKNVDEMRLVIVARVDVAFEYEIALFVPERSEEMFR